jgi:hypothetical protein
MSHTRLSYASILLLFLHAGCAANSTSSSTVSTVISDTLGNTFDVSCSDSYCALTPKNSSLTPVSCELGDGTDAFVLVWGRILSIAAVQVTPAGDLQLSAANPAHPVVCTTDAECLSPDLQVSVNNAAVAFSCMNGLCQLPPQALMTMDVVALCQADIPWPTLNSCPYVTSPQFASRLVEVASVCGSSLTCATVPANCRQLGPAADAGSAPTVDAGSAPAVDAGSAPAVDADSLDAQ